MINLFNRIRYGVNIVLGEFGAGKTFYTFYSAYKYKKRYKDDILIVANAPYPFVDVFYSSPNDLTKIMKFLVEYIKKTNEEKYLKKEFKRLYLIVDEAHLYFPSSGFGFGNKLGYSEVLVITQCRKRNLKIDFITQELGQLNKRVRVLAPYVRKYYVGFYFYRWYRDYYIKTLDSTDLKSEEVAEVIGGGVLMGGKLHPKFYKAFKEYSHISKYVVGEKDVLDLSKIEGYLLKDFS